MEPIVDNIKSNRNSQLWMIVIDHYQEILFSELTKRERIILCFDEEQDTLK